MMTAARATMASRVPRHAHRAAPGGYDRVLLVAVVALLSLGAIMVYSASVATDKSLRLDIHSLLGHLTHMAIGALLLGGCLRLPLCWVQHAARPLFGATLVLLALVLVPGIGVEVNGSRRWLDLGALHVQPSELLKVAAVIYFADYLARKRAHLHHLRVSMGNTALVLAVPAALLLMEPDFGAVAVLALSVAIMLFLAGVRLSHFCIGFSAGAVVLSALMWGAPYRVQRLLSYRDPWADPFDGGFQLVQALIAIGRGEWWGSGLGSSIQKLFYLPHAANDFLIAVIAEELGAIGLFAVLILFALVLWRAFAIAARAMDQGELFAAYLAQGLGVLLALQAAVHTGVNTGLLPTKGLTLPLMSLGGSSLVSCMLAVGLLFLVDSHTRARPRRAS